MIQLILMLNLAGLNTQTQIALNPQPCVWPNTCSQEAVIVREPVLVAQVQPCVWPNRCSADQTL